MRDSVAIKTIKIISSDLGEAIRLVWNQDIVDGDFIVIKPNLCDFRPSWEGGTTDPMIVRAFIKLIRKSANPKIAIVESDHAIGDADDEFERLGYKKLAEELNVDLINLSKDKLYDVILNGYYFETLKSPESLLKATKIVSISKLKTHSQQKITCSMKNLFGLLPRKSKSKYHPFMNEVLADLNEFYKPSLCIIDGIIGMEGFGPSDGDKKELGIVICGTNPVATDAVAARVMGFSPKEVPYLKFAEKVGLGTASDIDILGDYTPTGRFQFIPFYSYLAYRISFFMERTAYKNGRFLEGVAKFISQLSVGSIVLRKGYFLLPEFGVLRRKHAFLFIKGMVFKAVLLLRLKVKGIL